MNLSSNLQQKSKEELISLIGSLQETITKKNTFISNLRDELALAKHRHYGSKSEKVDPAQVFLFDEATSSLDSITEKEIQKSLNQISCERTTLVIAHRLSTIIDADEIIVLEAGRIVERGRHDQLLKSKGVYASMWLRQQQEAQKNEQLVD